jgi:hypothetical protein
LKTRRFASGTHGTGHGARHGHPSDARPQPAEHLAAQGRDTVFSRGHRDGLLGGHHRGDVHVDGQVEWSTPDRTNFARLEGECPSLTIRLVRNLVRSTADTVGQLATVGAAMDARPPRCARAGRVRA